MTVQNTYLSRRIIMCVDVFLREARSETLRRVKNKSCDYLSLLG
jgi:hypothetical protein